jgi:DNA-binding phage protein
METVKLRKWDSAEHLKTEEGMVLYLEACMEEAGDDGA